MKFLHIITVAIALLFSHYAGAIHWNLTAKQKKAIGLQIWQNEASKKYDLLVFWNQNEQFPSLGICHFIWFPTHCAAPYVQTFPAFIEFLKTKKIKLPPWLAKACATGAPWKNRQDFLNHENDKQVVELKKFLFDTIDLQVEFSIQHLKFAMNGMCRHVPQSKKQKIQHCFSSMCKTPQGLYALIDYLNFKGDGTNPIESYNGKRWGLLQVFEGIPPTVQPREIVAEFVKSAKKVLEQRVAHAPANKKEHEKKWLIGWKKRIDTYLTFKA